MANVIKTIARRLAAAMSVMLRGQHYDNATTTIENRRHWGPAKDQPPIVQNTPDTRSKLRARARYECANNCVDSQTEILTYDGWKLAPTISLNDMLATVNLDTDIIEYQKPVAVYHIPYNGMMIRVGGKKNQRIDKLVTPDHRTVVSTWNDDTFKFVNAKDLTYRHRIKSSAKWVGNTHTSISVPVSDTEKVSVSATLLAEFLGWIAAEGCLSTGYRACGNSSYYVVRISQSKLANRGKFDRIKSLLNSLPWKFSEFEMGFQLSGFPVYSVAYQCGVGAANKRVPQWIKDADVNVIRAFVDAAVDGDGNRHTDGFRYDTGSKQLADDMSELILKLGYAVSVSKVPAKVVAIGSSFKQTLDHYCARTKSPRPYSLASYRNKSIVSKESYSGTVHCATVPNGTLIIRRNGKVSVTGNCYASGLVSRLATETIGYTAPTPQINTGDNGLNNFLEDEWGMWTEAPVVNLAEKLYTMDYARRTDGESFPLTITDTDVTESQTGYAVNLVIVPQSRVSSFYSRIHSYYGQVETREVERRGYSTIVRLINDDGVLVNALTGYPHEFTVNNVVDETLGSLIGSNAVTVSERYMKQWFRPIYPGQFRGVCEIAAALGLFGQLRRFGLATLGAAEIAAMMTLILKTNLPADDSGQPTPLAPFSTREFERNMVTAMPDGWDAMQMKAEHPISNYEMFVNMVLREIGRVLDIPFGIVAGDFSKYNYSSARLEVSGYDETKKYDRKQLAIKILNPLHFEWLNEVVRRRPDVEKVIREGKYKLTWQFTNRPSIDPLKDATVDDMRLKNGTTSYSDVYAFRGMDYREAFQQISKENSEKKEFSLDFSEKSGNMDSQTDVQRSNQIGGDSFA